MESSTDIVIAGAGIAGLTMALTCHQIGLPASVYEAAPELLPLGLGINLQAPAVRELVDLGLGDELTAIGVPTRRLSIFDRRGDEIFSEPRGVEAGYRWPQVAVHRGELQMMLHRAVVDRLGSDVVVTGCGVSGYEHTRDGVVVELERPAAATDRIEAGVLLGCDGLHSAVRRRMFPGEGSPRWGGSVLWRGMARGPMIGGGDTFVVVGDAEQRFVTFPISSADPDTGLTMHNWIAELRFDPLRGWRRGDWNTVVETDEFIDAFEEWSFTWLDVPELIRGSERIFEYPMVDRDPAPHWVHGAVALVGDAAHPMYPVGSNGASQAIVDTRILGASFVEHGVGVDALDAYQSSRHEEMSALAMRNRVAGPASALDVADDAAAAVFAEIEQVPSEDLARFRAEYRARSCRLVDEFNAASPTIRPSTDQPVT